MASVAAAARRRTATAASAYDATAGLTLTLSSVTDLSGSAVSDDWGVFIEQLFPTTSMNSTGDGIANASTTSSFVGYLPLNIGVDVIQTAMSDGSASNGTAISDASIGVYFQTIFNNSAQTLSFNFDYDIIALATATGDDALSSASIQIDKGLFTGIYFVDVLASANDDQSTSGSFSFEVTAGNVGQFNTALNSNGSATSVVPVPAAAWLFGNGLIGLVGVARRKKT